MERIEAAAGEVDRIKIDRIIATEAQRTQSYPFSVLSVSQWLLERPIDEF